MMHETGKKPSIIGQVVAYTCLFATAASVGACISQVYKVNRESRYLNELVSSPVYAETQSALAENEKTFLVLSKLETELFSKELTHDLAAATAVLANKLSTVNKETARLQASPVYIKTVTDIKNVKLQRANDYNNFFKGFAVFLPSFVMTYATRRNIDLSVD